MGTIFLDASKTGMEVVPRNSRNVLRMLGLGKVFINIFRPLEPFLRRL